MNARKYLYIVALFILCIAATGCHKWVEPKLEIGATTLAVGDTTFVEWDNVKIAYVYLQNPEDSICTLTDSTSNSIKVCANSVGTATLVIDLMYMNSCRDATGAPGIKNIIHIDVLPKE